MAQPDNHPWYQYIRSVKNTTDYTASELRSLSIPPNVQGKMQHGSLSTKVDDPPGEIKKEKQKGKERREDRWGGEGRGEEGRAGERGGREEERNEKKKE